MLLLLDLFQRRCAVEAQFVWAGGKDLLFGSVQV
jgi:hypothetical protein